jgi:hypothetical protein
MLPPARSAKAKKLATMKTAANRRIWAKATKSASLPTAARVVAEAGGPPQKSEFRGGIEPRSARVFVRPTATARPRKK